MSQYANSHLGWTFAAALGGLGLAIFALAYLTCLPPRRRTAAILLGVSGAGLVLAALVPASVAGRTAADATHQAGATVGLGFLLVAALVVAAPLRREPLARGILALVAVAGASLIMLVAAAYRIEPWGLGAQRAWALYQTVAVVCEVAIVYLLLALLSRRYAALPSSTAP